MVALASPEATTKAVRNRDDGETNKIGVGHAQRGGAPSVEPFLAHLQVAPGSSLCWLLIILSFPLAPNVHCKVRIYKIAP